MIRRSFRLGLRLGLLAGVGIAIYKMLQARQAQPELPSRDPWPPVTPPAPAAPVERPAPAPAAPVEQPAPPPVQAPSAEPHKAPVEMAVAPTEPAAPKPGQTWVEPSGGVCPTSHPIKAKLTSKIFHLPGMFAYNRTNPDRCYAEEADAVADGLTKAKR